MLELKSQTFQKLSTSVEEEKSKEDWFLEISAREEKASQTLRQLQKEIKAEKAEREKQVSAERAELAASGVKFTVDPDAEDQAAKLRRYEVAELRQSLAGHGTSSTSAPV